ncbi:hypothetical protein COOONC_23897, partial [Cooperia oncophora]
AAEATPTTGVVLSIADYDALLDRLRQAATASVPPPIPAPSSTVALPPAFSPAASSSATPVFSKANLQKQFDFNSGVIKLITPVLLGASSEADKDNLGKAITALTQRNELLVVADKDPSVWQFYDRQVEAQQIGRY